MCPSLKNELQSGFEPWLGFKHYLHPKMPTFMNLQPIEREGTYKTFSTASMCCLCPPGIASPPQGQHFPKAAPHITRKPHYSIWDILEVKSNDPHTLPFVNLNDHFQTEPLLPPPSIIQNFYYQHLPSFLELPLSGCADSHCQRDWIWNHPGDTPLSMPVKIFSEMFNKDGRPPDCEWYNSAGWTPRTNDGPGRGDKPTEHQCSLLSASLFSDVRCSRCTFQPL